MSLQNGDSTLASQPDIAGNEMMGLTIIEIRLLPSIQRKPWVEKIRVIYPRITRIDKAIERCHKGALSSADPPCMLLVGPTGAGKSTVKDLYGAKYPAEYFLTWVRRRVVTASMPSNPTTKLLATHLLEAFGDPRADMGTEGSMTVRVKGYIRDCQVELLLLDELQHFVDEDRGNGRVIQSVSNWLKNLVKETKVACVLIGLEGRAEQVVDKNEQLARLFGDPYVLPLFRWIAKEPQTIKEFRAILKSIETQLPLREDSGLASLDIAPRCYIASGGLMAYLMALVRSATNLALERGLERLDCRLLGEAFDERLAPKRRGIANPFIGETPDPELWVPKPQRQRDPEATGHRSISRRVRRVGSND